MGWASKSKRLAREAQQIRTRTRTSVQEGTKRRPLIEQPGLIAVVSGDRTTYPQFVGCLATIQAPGGTQFYQKLSSAGAVAMARNECVHVARARGAAWVWFIDDDHGLRMDILAATAAAQRGHLRPDGHGAQAAHDWVAWEHFPIPDGATDAQLADLCDEHSRPPTIRAGQTGLVELGHCGAAGSVVAIEVFKACRRRGTSSANSVAIRPARTRCLRSRRGASGSASGATSTRRCLTCPRRRCGRRATGDRMGHVIEMDSTLRAARLSGSAIDDTCCGACGTDLSDGPSSRRTA